MYKTAVYTLVIDGITHQKQQISQNSDITRIKLTLRRCHAA